VPIGLNEEALVVVSLRIFVIVFIVPINDAILDSNVEVGLIEWLPTLDGSLDLLHLLRFYEFFSWARACLFVEHILELPVGEIELRGEHLDCFVQFIYVDVKVLFLVELVYFLHFLQLRTGLRQFLAQRFSIPLPASVRSVALQLFLLALRSRLYQSEVLLLQFINSLLEF